MRAQFVALLARALQPTAKPDTKTFRDVPADAWYRESIDAAVQANIASGMTESAFLPDEYVTREQMASMLVNAYVYAKGKKLQSPASTSKAKYEDEDAISPWAIENVRLASALGLMNGEDAFRFHPSNSATRAQAAVVISRLLRME